ncbi:hypothetical protein BDD12DRAFT_726155 [Trichophaea hybrida]|nr:hypothetical protein BDD12DRAFT_726155 [Trichophaea hybrida]
MSTGSRLSSGHILKRQDEVYYYTEGDLTNSWYYSDQASAIKYGILFTILAIGFIAIFGSWFHARSRLKKGLPPLAYHRWLVPRHERARFEPHLREPEQNFTFYGRQDYDMHAVPPPVYNPNLQQPPAYSGGPPPAFAKTNPFQDPQHQQPPLNGEGSSHIAPPPQVHNPPQAGYPSYPPQYS